MLSREASVPVVYINGFFSDARCISARESTGGANIEEAEFEWDLAQGGPRLQGKPNRPIPGLEAPPPGTPPPPPPLITDFHGRSTSVMLLQDTEVVSWIANATCEVTIGGGRLGRRQRSVHFGRIAKNSIKLNEEGESFSFRSRFDHHMFGNPWHAVPTVSFPSLYTRNVDAPRAVLNPTINDKPFGNAAIPTNAGFTAPAFFLEHASIPESVWSPDGRYNLPGLTGVFSRDPLSPASNLAASHYWTIGAAVWHVCWVLNPHQTYVANPPLRSLLSPRYANGPLFDPSLLRDHVIERGDYLPDILDALLHPYGFDWYVYKQPGRRQIVIKERGVANPALTGGGLTNLGLQRLGDDFDNRKTQVKAINLDTSLVDAAANTVIVVGGHEEVEGTFELIPGWDPKYDKMKIDEIDKIASMGSEEIEKHPGIERAWRDWVLNEGGDYIGLRRPGKGQVMTGASGSVSTTTTLGEEEEEDDPAEFPSAWDLEYRKRFLEPFDLSKLFILNYLDPNPRSRRKPGVPQNLLERRRKFLPTISENTRGEPYGPSRGLYVEIHPYDGDEDAGPWIPLGNPGAPAITSVQPLTNECGIRFVNMKTFPTELRSLGIEHLRVRVTAVIRNDYQVKYVLGAHRDFLADQKVIHIDRSRSMPWRHYAAPRGNQPQPHTSVLEVKRIQQEIEQANFEAFERDEFPVFGDKPLISILDGSRDERAAMILLANRMLLAWNQARISGSITLDGIDYLQPFIGYTLQGLQPRNIGMQVRPPGPKVFAADVSTKVPSQPPIPPKWPDIVGVDYLMNTQEIKLTLETFRRS